MLAGFQRGESASDRQPEENKSDQSLTFNDPLWPMQWELVGLIVCLCVFLSSLVLSRRFLSPPSARPGSEGCAADRHKSGRLSCVTGGRSRGEREVRRLRRKGEKGGEKGERGGERGCPR